MNGRAGTSAAVLEPKSEKQNWRNCSALNVKTGRCGVLLSKPGPFPLPNVLWGMLSTTAPVSSVRSTANPHPYSSDFASSHLAETQDNFPTTRRPRKETNSQISKRPRDKPTRATPPVEIHRLAAKSPGKCIRSMTEYLMRRRLGTAPRRPHRAFRTLLRSPGALFQEVHTNEDFADLWVLEHFMCINSGESITDLSGKHLYSLLDRGRGTSTLMAMLEHCPITAAPTLIGLTTDACVRLFDSSTGAVLRTRRLPHPSKPIGMEWLTNGHVVIKSKAGPTLMLTILDPVDLGLVTQVRFHSRYFGGDMQDVRLLDDVLWVRVAEETWRCFAFETLLDKNCQSSKKHKNHIIRTAETPDTHGMTGRPRPLFEITCADQHLNLGHATVLPDVLVQRVVRDEITTSLRLICGKTGKRIGTIGLDNNDDEDTAEQVHVQFYHSFQTIPFQPNCVSANAAPPFAPPPTSSLNVHRSLQSSIARLLCWRPSSVSIYSIKPHSAVVGRGVGFRESEAGDENDSEGDGPVQGMVCTYEQGYVTQNIHICSTCIEHSKQVFGICTFCKVHCHAGHETIDIGTRHDFRCDCGVSSRSLEKCLLTDELKARVNKKNVYNHNFHLRYCVCDGQDFGGIMVQCTSCDDWLHGECAGLEGEEEFDMDGDADFLCNSCIATMPHGLKGREVLFKVKLGQFVASVRPDTSGDDATGTNYVLEEEVRIHATDPSRPVVNGVVTGGSHHTRLGSRNRRRDAETEGSVTASRYI
eukprot:c18912_g1_i1.p1 GENE.c18912_g1_i1~~c18912_g1_i1.p1  ORF type:complete len:768 (+),score=162.92 c18912_g1_i1:41-2305(+)